MTATFQPLPHAIPFRFADRTIERTGPASGRVAAVVSANAHSVRAGALPPFLVGELIAQAALLLQGGDPEIGRSGFLASVSGVAVERLAWPGDVLAVEVRLAGRLGPAVRFDGTIRDGGGHTVATGSVTVRQGETPAAEPRP